MQRVRTDARVVLPLLVCGVVTSLVLSASPGTATAATDPSTPCDYFASPNGRGHGRMTSSPFRIEDFWAVARPGTTLCLLDGVYRGSASMIVPPSGLSGTARDPITIRALNDGKVLLDGQFTRYPVRLNSNNHWIIEGLNAKNSSCDVVRIENGSRDNVVRRVVGWDTPIGNTCAIFRALYTSGPNLFEDVAGFGAASRIFGCNQQGNGTTFRRVWGRFEGSLNGNNVNGAVSTHYTCRNVTWENVLATVDTITQPTSATVHNRNEPDRSLGRVRDGETVNPAGVFFTNKNHKTSNRCVNVEALGSLAYITSTAKLGGLTTGYHNTNRDPSAPEAIECYRGQHVAVIVDPDHPEFRSFRAFGLGKATSVATTFRHITSVSGNGNSFTNWTVQQQSHGTTVGAVPNLWTNRLDHAGANLCHRYVNRVRTTTPLWPWPMNERIRAATAMAGNYSGPCETCVGEHEVRTATDVTAEIEALLGPIPAQCRVGA